VPGFHIDEPLEAPDLEVEVEGEWLPAEARMRTTYDDGRIELNVQCRRHGHTSWTASRARGRLATTERSRGRV